MLFIWVNLSHLWLNSEPFTANAVMLLPDGRKETSFAEEKPLTDKDRKGTGGSNDRPGLRLACFADH